jgi:hypothetical protein
MGSWHRLVLRAAAALARRGKWRRPSTAALRGEHRRAADVLRRMRALQDAVLKLRRD